MVLRVAIVGPGRVGQAFAQQLAGSGADVLGFVGRDPARTAAAVAALGCGRVLSALDLRRAHAVLFAVGDEDLAGAVQGLLPAAARTCCLWAHTSGRHDLTPLRPAEAVGMRIGSLHPVAPFGDVAAGRAAMPGAPLVIQAPQNAVRLLVHLAGRLGMQAIVCGEQDRTRYHAACALAANGLTALFALAEAHLRLAGGLPNDAPALLTRELMLRALQAIEARGPAAALSGPVRRGDEAAVRSHLAVLRDDPTAHSAYRALMRAAVMLAERAGLPAAQAARVRAQLDGGSG